MKKKHLIILCSLLISALLITAVALTLGRYADVFVSTQTVTPGSFYFETDLHADETYLVAAGQPFRFHVRNHDALGHVTAKDISFTVNGTAYTLPANIATDLEITVGAEAFGAVGTTHTVTVSATAPYAKTIALTVQVVDASAVNCYSVTDMGSYVQLDVYVGDTVPTQDIIIHYTGFSPDNTNDLMRTWMSTDGSATLAAASLQPYSHYTLIFFGTGSVTTVNAATLSGLTSITLNQGG